MNFLSVWKIMSVTPVFKSGDLFSVINYRPISISSHIANIFESFVINQIGPSLNRILIPQQHGFRKGKSTITSSVLFSSFILDDFEDNDQVNVILTDFSKEFDTVPHNILSN
ncbi:Reverse transcriptase domain [Cinara cedri]|uniref:Reverse transcriptase domain n=1 Tax=Cinara cedri TaxID=506608 RepID=A0A5E4MF16_9HEMI|nr:Reverse transcriptase domain [Cinara cedri]